MQKSKKILLLVITAIAVAAGGYLAFQKIYLPYKFEQLTQKLIIAAITQMDDDRLAGQVIHIAIPGTELNDQNRKVITELKPGGIIFFGFNLKQADEIKKFTTDLQQLAAELKLLPFLISTDQEGGYVKRVPEGVLKTPPARNLGDAKDSELCRATGYYVSRDLGTLGINVFFAPIVDINNNPENPVIGLRSFGTTLPAVLACALPFEQGARLAHAAGGAMPVIKHFPGHGDTHVDSHWALPVIEKKLEELKSFELIPFRDSIASGAKAVMTAHILYPQIDKDAPATLSEKWLTQTLRRDLKFKGLIFTDAMEMSAISQHYEALNPPVAALKAGADVLLYTSWQDDPPEAKKRIIEEFKAGGLNFKSPSGESSNQLVRAVYDQINAKLPYLKTEKYLTADEARWYAEYRAKIVSDKNLSPVKLSQEAVKEKFAAIHWTPPRKRNQPQWLAAKKNIPK